MKLFLFGMDGVNCTCQVAIFHKLQSTLGFSSSCWEGDITNNIHVLKIFSQKAKEGLTECFMRWRELHFSVTLSDISPWKNMTVYSSEWLQIPVILVLTLNAYQFPNLFLWMHRDELKETTSKKSPILDLFHVKG